MVLSPGAPCHPGATARYPDVSLAEAATELEVAAHCVHMLFYNGYSLSVRWR